MRSRLLVGLLAVVAVVPVQAQSELDARLRMAVSKLEQGDAINALIDIEAILARDDRYWPAYYHLGRTQVQLGDDLGAKASFLHAAELNPGDAELHYLIATVGWQLADFGAAWTHGIAAIQAGYDRRGVEQLFKELRHYSDEPTNLEQRLAAPAVLVVEGGTHDQGGQSDSELTSVVRELRSEIFRSPELASVQEASLARYRVEVERLPPDPADDASGAGEPIASFATALFAVADDAPVAEFVLRLEVSAGDSESMFEISHVVAKLEAAILR
jgi:tetratricopeptide (TPR) repeat protein